MKGARRRGIATNRAVAVACDGGGTAPTPPSPTTRPAPGAPSTSTTTAAPGTSTTAPPADPVVLTAGDIASCSSRGDEATAALLDARPCTLAHWRHPDRCH